MRLKDTKDRRNRSKIVGDFERYGRSETSCGDSPSYGGLGSQCTQLDCGAQPIRSGSHLGPWNRWPPKRAHDERGRKPVFEGQFFERAATGEIATVAEIREALEQYVGNPLHHSVAVPFFG